MPIKKDESGRRWVEAEVEVAGTPEQVWQAIATGPGISAWFVPTEVEERAGGVASSNFGPGMESEATITAWDPPHRFVANSESDLGPNAPSVASEWIVEAGAGGTCVVRVVHSLFTEDDDWDDQLEGWAYGWPSFFRILAIYLRHFPGLPSAAFQLMGAAPAPRSEAWAALTGALGIASAEIGARVHSSPTAPPLGGVVELVGVEDYPELLLRLDSPAPGVAHLFPMELGGRVLLSVRLYLYGDEATDAVATAQSRWQEWLGEHLPADGGAESAATD